jgi:hypothetical protein
MSLRLRVRRLERQLPRPTPEQQKFHADFKNEIRTMRNTRRFATKHVYPLALILVGDTERAERIRHMDPEGREVWDEVKAAGQAVGAARLDAALRFSLALLQRPPEERARIMDGDMPEDLAALLEVVDAPPPLPAACSQDTSQG